MFLYYMDVSNLDLEKVKRIVSKDRFESSKKYFYQKDRLLHIGSYALLNHILKKIKIDKPEYGITTLKH